MTTKKGFQLFTWVLAVVVIGLAALAWSEVRLTGRTLSAYDVFPILGLSAFSLMWTHYTTDAVRRRLKLDSNALKQYFAVTSSIVLVLILLHPTIFLAQLYIDGFGLPPFSYWDVYTGFTQRIALLLGTLSLLAFLSFELYRWFKKKSWWRYIEYANIAAMAAIFYHALTLGGELGLSWFRTIWFVYGCTLVVAVVYNQVQRKREKLNE
jgi:hypothetical protein